MSLPGLSQINIELTANCSKRTKCFMCGHTSFHNPDSNMSFALLESLVRQLPSPIIASLHRDGDSLDYPELQRALELLSPFVTSIVTHGERLAERAEEIIGRATTVTVSIVPNDPDRDIQLESIRSFLEKKGDRPPTLQLKFVGQIPDPSPYEALGVRIINRALHSKKGNWSYVRVSPIAPECGVCLDFLSRPTIDWRGRMFVCNRLSPDDAGLIGDLTKQSLDEIWNGPERARMLKAHISGRRDLANPLCASCESWGIPTPSGL